MVQAIDDSHDAPYGAVHSHGGTLNPCCFRTQDAHLGIPTSEFIGNRLFVNDWLAWLADFSHLFLCKSLKRLT